MPRERLASVMPSAEGIEVRSGGCTARNWLMMIKIGAVGRHGAGWELTGAGADPDRLGEPGRGVAAEFGCVEQPTAIVGEESGKNTSSRLFGSRASAICSRSSAAGMSPDRSANSAGASLAPSRLASGTTTPIRSCFGRFMNRVD
jgi:hypothetical protein